MANDKLAGSLKALYTVGAVKKTDQYKVHIDLLEFEEGFNLRDDDEELKAHIESIAQYILAGGTLPPLEVRVVDGNIKVVDGHCRTCAYRLARDRGALIEEVPCIPFTGNDADRVVKMIASSHGKPLSPLQTGIGYKRLVAFGLDSKEIAARMGTSRQHVEQLLLLANANSDVHAMVRAGKVSAAVAINVIQQKGEKAGEVLAAAHVEARASGKTKVTAKTIKPWTPPAKVLAPLVSSIGAFIDSLTTREREILVQIESDPTTEQTVMVNGAQLLALLKANAEVELARFKEDEKARAKVEKAAQTTIEGVA